MELGRWQDKKTKRQKGSNIYTISTGRIHKEISCSLTLGINQLAAQPKSKQKNIRRRKKKKKEGAPAAAASLSTTYKRKEKKRYHRRSSVCLLRSPPPFRLYLYAFREALFFYFCFDFGSLSLSLSVFWRVLAVSLLRPTRSTYTGRISHTQQTPRLLMI